jgi:hypothetical protein
MADRPRRAIRGYRKLNTGYGETRTRELMKLGLHPLPIKGQGQRACSWFEDEIAAMQAQLAEQRNAAAPSKVNRPRNHIGTRGR